MTELKSAPKRTAKPNSNLSPKQPVLDSSSLPDSPAPTQTSLTPNNVIYLQRTIGNAATVRLLAQQRQSEAAALDTSTDHQAGDLWIQRFPTSTDVAKRSDEASIKNMSGTFNKVLEAVEAYNTVIKSKVPTNLRDRKGAVEGSGYNNYLTKILTLAELYIKDHADDKKRLKTVASFRTLLNEVYLERDALAKVVKDATYDIAKNQVTWQEAIRVAQTGRNPRISALASHLGLAPAFLEGLNENSLGHLAQANEYMKQNNVVMARTALQGLETTQKTEFRSLRTALFRANLTAIRPELAAAIDNPNFKQTDAASVAGDKSLPKVALSMLETAQKHLDAYEGTESYGASKKDMKAWLKKFQFKGDLTPEKEQAMKERIAIFQNRQAWEKENVNIKDYKNLRNFEKSAAAGYSTDYKPFNYPVREDIMGANNANFDGTQASKMQNLISALNALPPFVGKTFRHDSNYPGFSALNQVGSVTTDLGFYSSTRDATNLRRIPGSEDPEVLILIEGKTGRFFKPLSQYNKMLALQPHDDENEVLFKPGTRFRVVRRFDRAQFGEMDADLRSLLNQDELKAKIQIVIHKVEV